MANVQFDATDQALLDARMVSREAIEGPRLGDYVRFSTGELERISKEAGEKLQTSPIWAGSYFLHSHGVASFSGGLNPPISLGTLSYAGETEAGKFWFFHHDMAGPDRGVRFTIPCRVYVTSAEYHGCLTRDISCTSCAMGAGS